MSTVPTPLIMANWKAPQKLGVPTLPEHLTYRPFAEALKDVTVEEERVCVCGKRQGASIHATRHPVMRGHRTHEFERVR